MIGLAGTGRVIRRAPSELSGDSPTKKRLEGLTALCVSSNKICGRYVTFHTLAGVWAGLGRAVLVDGRIGVLSGFTLKCYGAHSLLILGSDRALGFGGFTIGLIESDVMIP